MSDSFTGKNKTMPRTLLILLILYIGSVNAQQQSPEVESKFKSLKWLEGRWERSNVKPGMKANEQWQVYAPYQLKGIGVMMKGEDTVFLEKIQIIIKEGNIYYVADVKENKAPVYFKFTSVTPHGFICENPEHDFPKKIVYELNGSKLVVTISDDSKSQNYFFIRL